MPRGRPPTSPEMKRLTGNPGKRPIKEGMKVTGKLAAPSNLSPIAKATWTQIVRACPENTYLITDSVAFAVFCEAVADYWTAAKLCAEKGRYVEGSKEQMVIAPWAKDKADQARLIYTFGQRLYLDPVARASVMDSLPGSDEPDDEMARLMN